VEKWWKTKELMDSRGQTLFLSSTEGANSIYDGKQIYKDLKKLPKVHLTHIFDPKTDNIAMDNHFPSYIKKFIEKFKDYGYSDKNMTSPIAKKKGIELTNDEELYKLEYSGYRSIQESEKFGNFVSVFKRFSIHNKKQTTNFESFNLQLQVCLVIFNISNYLKRYDYMFKELYEEFNVTDWIKINFDYPYKEEPEIVSDRLIDIEENSSDIYDIQEEFIKDILTEKKN